MKKIYSTLFLPLLVLFGCQPADSENPPIPLDDRDALIAYMKAHPEAVFLDVRTEEEFKKGHIPGAKLLPLKRLEQDIAQAVPMKETPVIVYCQSGFRSKKAAKKLRQAGYSQVGDFGGIGRWQGALKTGLKKGDVA